MKAIGLFYTPESMQEMQDIMGRLPAAERALVYPYVMMMYNVAIKTAALKCAQIADDGDICREYNIAGEICDAFGLDVVVG